MIANTNYNHKETALYIPKMSKTEKSDNTKSWQEHGPSRTLTHCWWNCQHNHFGTDSQLLIKLNIHLLYLDVLYLDYI